MWCERVRKVRALRRQSVQVWCLNKRMSVAGDGIKAVLVGMNQQYRRGI